jgi:hypothetical protein
VNAYEKEIIHSLLFMSINWRKPGFLICMIDILVKKRDFILILTY